MGARFCAIMSLGDRITGRYDRALSAAFRSYLWISFSLSVNAAWPEPLNFATVLKSRVITQIYPLRSFFSTTSFQNFLLLRSRSFFFQCLPPPLPSLAIHIYMSNEYTCTTRPPTIGESVAGAWKFARPFIPLSCFILKERL